MRLLDANLLIAAYNDASPSSKKARKWLEDALWDDEPVATGWMVVLAFLRLSTNSRVFPRPLSSAEAVAVVDQWFDEAGLELVHPTDRHWQLVRGLVSATGARGNLMTDIHLAALALEHGATLCTDDEDFRRFKGLRLELPLR